MASKQSTPDQQSTSGPPQQTVSHTHGAADDARRRIEQLLKQQMAVNQLARQLGSTLDLNELCRIAHREIEKIVGFTNLGISTYDATTQQIQALFIIADGEFVDVSRLPAIALEPGTGPQSRAITTHLPDIVDDMEIERARVKTYVNVQTRDPRRTRAILTVPLVVGDQVVGTMQMQSYEPGAYSAVDIPLLTGMANQFALAFQNAKLYAQVERELAERKRSEWQRELLNRILTVFQLENDDGMYYQVLTILKEATASRCGFFGYIAAGGDLVCPAVTCARHKIEVGDGQPIRLSGGWKRLFGETGEVRGTVAIDRRVELPIGEMVFDRAIIMPLMQGAEAIGVLAVANRDSAYDPEQIEFLNTIGAQISPVLAARLQRDREQMAREAALIALGEREEQYRLLFAANPVPMWVYDLESYRFLDVNEAAVIQYGYTRTEFLRMRLHDIRPTEELARFEANLHQPRTPFETSGPWQHRKKCGEIILVEISSHTLQWHDRPAVVVQARDVTARVHAERALAASERKFRDLAEQLPGLILILDDTGVRYVNARGAAMLGRTVTEILSPAFDYAPFVAPDLPSPGSVVPPEEFGTAEDGFYEIALNLPGGRALTLWSASKHIEFEDHSALLIVATDITEARRLEEQLRQAQKMEAIGVLAGGIAHDFNNLLTPIVSYTELMMSRAEAGSRDHRYLSQISTAAERATALVRQILAFSRTRPASLGTVNVCSCVDEVLDLLRPTLPSTIELRRDFCVPDAYVLADSHEIVQVILNLCTNAYQAIGEVPGSIAVRVERMPGDVPASPGAASAAPPPEWWVRLSVQDSGTGIDLATQEHIFEPFFTTKRAGKGTGLGLPVVYGVVHKLGGRIDFDSEPGRGTTFVIDLPAMPGAPEAVEAAAAAVDDDGRGEHVLLVDDDAGTLDAMHQMLLEHGYRVSAFSDAAAALAAYRRNPAHFAVIVSDQVMPVMTGDELAAALRQAGFDVPVIVLTGYSERLTPALAAERGIAAVLAKPVGQRALLHALRTILVQPRTGAAPTLGQPTD